MKYHHDNHGTSSENASQRWRFGLKIYQGFTTEWENNHQKQMQTLFFSFGDEKQMHTLLTLQYLKLQSPKAVQQWHRIFSPTNDMDILASPNYKFYWRNCWFEGLSFSLANSKNEMSTFYQLPTLIINLHSYTLQWWWYTTWGGRGYNRMEFLVKGKEIIQSTDTSDEV